MSAWGGAALLLKSIANQSLSDFESIASLLASFDRYNAPLRLGISQSHDVGAGEFARDFILAVHEDAANGRSKQGASSGSFPSLIDPRSTKGTPKKGDVTEDSIQSSESVESDSNNARYVHGTAHVYAAAVLSRRCNFVLELEFLAFLLSISKSFEDSQSDSKFFRSQLVCFEFAAEAVLNLKGIIQNLTSTIVSNLRSAPAFDGDLDDDSFTSRKGAVAFLDSVMTVVQGRSSLHPPVPPVPRSPFRPGQEGGAGSFQVQRSSEKQAALANRERTRDAFFALHHKTKRERESADRIFYFSEPSVRRAEELYGGLLPSNLSWFAKFLEEQVISGAAPDVPSGIANIPHARPAALHKLARRLGPSSVPGPVGSARGARSKSSSATSPASGTADVPLDVFVGAFLDSLDSFRLTMCFLRRVTDRVGFLLNRHDMSVTGPVLPEIVLELRAFAALLGRIVSSCITPDDDNDDLGNSFPAGSSPEDCLNWLSSAFEGHFLLLAVPFATSYLETLVMCSSNALALRSVRDLVDWLNALRMSALLDPRSNFFGPTSLFLLYQLDVLFSSGLVSDYVPASRKVLTVSRETKDLDDAEWAVDDRFVFYVARQLDHVANPIIRARRRRQQQAIRRIVPNVLVSSSSTESKDAKVQSPDRGKVSEVQFWFFERHREIKPLVDLVVSSVSENALAIALSETGNVDAFVESYCEQQISIAMQCLLPTGLTPAVSRVAQCIAVSHVIPRVKQRVRARRVGSAAKAEKFLLKVQFNRAKTGIIQRMLREESTMSDVRKELERISEALNKSGRSQLVDNAGPSGEGDDASAQINSVLRTIVLVYSLCVISADVPNDIPVSQDELTKLCSVLLDTVALWCSVVKNVSGGDARSKVLPSLLCSVWPEVTVMTTGNNRGEMEGIESPLGSDGPPRSIPALLCALIERRCITVGAVERALLDARRIGRSQLPQDIFRSGARFVMVRCQQMPRESRPHPLCFERLRRVLSIDP